MAKQQAPYPPPLPTLSGWSKGLLLGLAFFLPGLLFMLRPAVVDLVKSGMDDLPVIHRLSQDFQTGFDLAGQLFLQNADRFYALNAGSPSADQLTQTWLDDDTPDAWRRAEIERKLEQSFGARRRRQAARYLDYIEQYRYLACREMVYSHIPASITLAQGLLESNAGDGYLAKVANNHFGIKCLRRSDYRRDGILDHNDFYHDDLAYDCEQRADDHPWDRFEKYESPEISFRRHSLLLTRSGRYNWMLDRYRVRKHHYPIDPKWFGTDAAPYYVAWAIGLKEGGYATSKRYAQKIAYLIDTYDLWKFDFQVIMKI